MSDIIACKTCGARLLSGASGGKLACPVCGSLLSAPRSGNPSTGHPDSSPAGRRSRSLIITIGIVGLALVALLFAQAQKRFKAGTYSNPQEVVIVGSPLTMLGLFASHPDTRLMRNALNNADTDALQDSEDCGLHMGLLEDWQQEIAAEQNDPDNLPAAVLTDWNQALTTYTLAAYHPHTRFDHARLLKARQWLIGMRSYLAASWSAGIKQPLVAESRGAWNSKRISAALPNPGQPIPPVSGLGSQSRLPAIIPGTIDSFQNIRDLTNELNDAHTIEIHYPKNPYGYRLHAEILIAIMKRPALLRAFKRPMDPLLAEARGALFIANRSTRSQTGAYVLKDDERELDTFYAKRYGGAGITPVEPLRPN